ncbi:MAG TPA: citrate synthase family protein [Acetobacteraceae bacterium]|nr:citrate synthase family protein [Acetobacteraceae bacterium]
MNDMDAPTLPVALTAAEAAARLGVSRQTLYAYVSRGLLRAHASQGQRTSRYDAGEVDRLAGRRAGGRKPKEVARATLNWGVPVLASAITLLANGRLCYRGQDAVALSRSASVEDVAALLWDMPAAAAFGGRAPPRRKARGAMTDVSSDTLLARFAAATGDDPTALWQMDSARIAEGCGALLRAQAACLLGSAPSAAPIHVQCAEAWKLDKADADLIRMALILCADHELNASSFTARCVASTGASLRAAIIGGLAALSGPRHGGMTARIEAFWDTLDAAPRPEVIVRQRLTGGEGVPGFGHPLYPDGDVRAVALLDRILPHHAPWRRWIEEVTALTGQFPNIDLGLVALRRDLRLPAGTAFGLFALGRSIGWIAHALEQRADTQLIRPRAMYVGPLPE